MSQENHEQVKELLMNCRASAQRLLKNSNKVVEGRRVLDGKGRRRCRSLYLKALRCRDILSTDVIECCVFLCMTMQGDTAWNEVQLLTYLRSALFLVNKLKEILPEDWNDKGRPWQLIREYICARIRSTSYSIMTLKLGIPPRQPDGTCNRGYIEKLHPLVEALFLKLGAPGDYQTMETNEQNSQNSTTFHPGKTPDHQNNQIVDTTKLQCCCHCGGIFDSCAKEHKSKIKGYGMTIWDVIEDIHCDDSLSTRQNTQFQLFPDKDGIGLPEDDPKEFIKPGGAPKWPGGSVEKVWYRGKEYDFVFDLPQPYTNEEVLHAIDGQAMTDPSVFELITSDDVNGNSIFRSSINLAMGVSKKTAFPGKALEISLEDSAKDQLKDMWNKLTDTRRVREQQTGKSTPMLRLPYNLSQSPYDAAIDFIKKNRLSEAVFNCTASFIRANVEGITVVDGEIRAPVVASSSNTAMGGLNQAGNNTVICRQLGVATYEKASDGKRLPFGFREYDYIVTFTHPNRRHPWKLPFNISQEPYAVATDFGYYHKLRVKTVPKVVAKMLWAFEDSYKIRK